MHNTHTCNGDFALHYLSMKAIIPIAGMGTRLLPFTKVIPKAMLPVHDRPCVQWIVEELNEAGVNDIIFVYSKGQEMVKEYFSEKTWYDFELQERGHHGHAERLEKIRALARFEFVEQKEQLGDGHAILQAKHSIPENEPFLVIFGDCLYQGDDVIGKMKQAYEKTNGTILAVQAIDPALASQYGIVTTNAEGSIQTMIEKPKVLEANNLQPKAIIGRYLLTPTIWSHLEKHHSSSGEIRLIDSLKELMAEEPVYGLELKGTWLDTGTLEGMQMATEVLKKIT